jgi:LmbE family N-acetylglucosaminyl deacetylase
MVAMLADAYFKQCEALPIRSLDVLAGRRGILVLAPHPDDESLGCGGLIALAARRGLRAQVVVLTDGTGSHRGSRRFPAERLRRLREVEARTAASRLGLAANQITFLRAPDQRAPGEGPKAMRAAAAVARIVRRIGAGILAVTWGGDPHRDHRAAFLIARLAQRHQRFDLIAYPIWGWTLPAKLALNWGRPRGFRLDIRRALESKSAAVLAHRSQLGQVIDDDPSGFCLDTEILARAARPFEIYLQIPLGAIQRVSMRCYFEQTSPFLA